MTLKEALVAAILEKPEQPVHRLALADLLEENGESGQATSLRSPGQWLCLEDEIAWIPNPGIMSRTDRAFPVLLVVPRRPTCPRCGGHAWGTVGNGPWRCRRQMQYRECRS